MATESVLSQLGLFNSPEQYQQSLATGALRRGVELAQLTPEQYGRSIGYSGASQIGRGLAGIMGAEDPMLQLISQRQSILRGIDRNDPQSVFKAAQALGQLGDTATATQLVKDAQEAALKQSQIVKNLRERPEKESELAMLQSERADIVAKYGENDPRVKQYDARIAKITTGKSLGQEIGEGLGLLGKALGAGLKKEGEETGQFAAKDFNALGNAVAAGTASKRNLATLETALQNSFTGKFADSKESIITSLTALGVPVGDDLKQAATNKQLIDAMGTRYVFPLVKNFPGSLAAKELDRLEKTAPNSLQQPETIQRLVNLMKVDLAENEYTYNQAKQYKASKNSLIGFNQADSKIEFQQKLNKLQGMVGTARRKGSVSKEEKDAIEALKQELGV